MTSAPPIVLSLASLGSSFLEKQHDVKVRRIAAQLRALDAKIDLTPLDQIIDIDADARVCIAESGVTFVELVAATLPYGLAPKIVPELKDITLGGAVSGCAVESASFRYGGFHDSCLEYEVLTAEGERLSCQRDGRNAEVFQMMHGTLGALGVLTQLTFDLVPARQFVQVAHEHHATLSDYLKSIWRHHQRRDADFLDGFVFGPEQLTLSVGHFADSAPYSHRYDWVKAYFETTRVRDEDFLRTPDYFFRYDRGVTHVTPKSALARLLFGKWLGGSQLLGLTERFRKLRHGEPSTVTLDAFIPFDKVAEFFVWWNQRFAFYPLWCVPYRLVAEQKDDLWLVFAIDGMKPECGAEQAHQEIDAELSRLGGFKTLRALYETMKGAQGVTSMPSTST